MSFLLNELSLHGQFSAIAEFEESLDTVMALRTLIRREGYQLGWLHRGELGVSVLADGDRLPQVVNRLNPNRRRALLSWITREGPFWDEASHHDGDDYFECDGEVVTDTSLAEAAWHEANGNVRRLVSFSPSDWLRSKVDVKWRDAEKPDRHFVIDNYWTEEQIRQALAAMEPPLSSWQLLEHRVRARCARLTISPDAFIALKAQPFAHAAAQRLLVLMGKLDKYADCFDVDGKRTEEGNEIYQELFTGKSGGGGRGAPFSDSSDTEKNDFEQVLTFRHPAQPGETLFCPMHGKTQTPQLRFHFSWPIKAGEPVFVVYVGPKLTKR